MRTGLENDKTLKKRTNLNVDIMDVLTDQYEPETSEVTCCLMNTFEMITREEGDRKEEMEHWRRALIICGYCPGPRERSQITRQEQISTEVKGEKLHDSSSYPRCGGVLERAYSVL